MISYGMRKGIVRHASRGKGIGVEMRELPPDLMSLLDSDEPLDWTEGGETP